MSEPTRRERLIHAKAMIEAGWAQGDPARWPPGCQCTLTAMLDAGLGPAEACGDEDKGLEDSDFFEEVNGLDGDVVRWNDDPVRTKAEVLAAFDKAIAAA